MLDAAVEQNLVEKSGTWHTYGTERIGQGRENAKKYLKDNPKILADLEVKVRAALGLKPAGGAPAPARAPESGQVGATMDFHQLLTECVKRSASDLHLKSGSRPIVRVHGHLETQDDLPAVTRDFMRKTAMTLLGEIRYNALMEGEEMDLAHTVPGRRPLPHQRLPLPGRRARRAPPHPRAHPGLRGAAPAQGAGAALPGAARAWCWSPASPAPASPRRSPP